MSTRATTRVAPISAWARTLLAPAVWLERARGRRRLGLACLYILVIGLAVVCLWWANSLNGLPDIGEPFDVRRLDVERVPDTENAFVLYRKACALSVRLSQAHALLYKSNPTWSQAAPEIRAWADANRQALAVWKEGAERPKALYVAPREMTFETSLDVVHDLRNLIRVADLEGSRLEEAGEREAAWAIYRAMLRSSRHIAKWGNLVQRLSGLAALRTAAGRVHAWAENPRVTAPQLRAALNEVIVCEAMTPPFSEAFEIEYLTMEKAFENRSRWTNYDAFDNKLWYQNLPGGREATVFLWREPERSRRVTRLVFANWLAYCDQPPRLRPKLVTDTHLYQPFANAPAAARALAPEALDRWCQSTMLVRPLLPAFEACVGAVDSERSVLAGLKVHLAEELYLREHGALPKQLGQLVGPYLERLPDGYDDNDIPLGEPADRSAAKRAPSKGSQQRSKP